MIERALGLATTLRAGALAAVLVFAQAPAPAQDGQRPAPDQAWLARVSHVVDGDSIWVRPSGGGARRRLRLDGIDAPEICQPLGPEARGALQALTLSQPVRVTVHAYDRWGRGIATVHRVSDGLDLGATLVAQGWAWAEGYRGRPWAKARYAPQEAEARRHRRGVFAGVPEGVSPETPADFRRRHGPCVPTRR